MARFRVGRPSNTFIVYLDANKFIKDLRSSVSKVTKELAIELEQKAKENVQGIPFKDNEVKLASGKVTSDAERKGAVLSSIIYEGLKWLDNEVDVATVSALKKKFSESHIGLYYEYGTGEEVDLNSPFFGSIGDWNPFRLPVAGAPIVTRSKYINGGYWRDLGGNLRVTESPRGGQADAGFREYIGEDVEAYHWFLNAYNEIKSKAIKKYAEAINSIHIDKYLRVKPQVWLGGRRTKRGRGF